MKAGEILINGIFNGSRLLEVPFYQRSYVWGEEQWDRFLEDMEYVTSTNQPYFLGSIILKNGENLPTYAPYSERKIVIDGQQRLTTLLVFLKALCLKNNADSLFVHDFRLEDGTMALSHGRSDREAFQKVVDAASAEKIEVGKYPSRIIEAFNYFLDKINTGLVDRNIIKKNIQFVSIDLVDEEDEQQVFDTINSLGVRLTTAELLKNYFFNQDNVEEYKEKWEDVFEKDDETKAYWEQEFETGRVKRSLIDIFFDAYFQMFIQDKKYVISAEDKIAFGRVDRISKSFQDFIKNYCGGDKSVVIGPLKEYANCFASLFRPECCNMGVPAKYGMERINVVIFGLKTSTLIPYILYLRMNIKDDDEFNNMMGVLESFVMRRMITRASTKSYNNLVSGLILNGVTDTEAFKDRINNSNDSYIYFPTDDEVKDGFDKSKLTNLYTKGILYLIESGCRSGMSSTSLLGFDSYSLEHLMPKKWRNNWEKPNTDEECRLRDSQLLTLGNLAIIPQSLNSSIRDADWNVKRAGKGKDKPGLDECAAGLLTMKDVLNKDNWDETEISKRSTWLYEKSKFIWTV